MFYVNDSTDTLTIDEGESYHSLPIKWKASILPKKVFNKKEATEQKREKEKKTIKEYVKECKLPIFLPFGLFLLFWNVFSFILLIYSVIETPFTIAFVTNPSNHSVSVLITLCIDIFLLTDILINFRVK